MPDQTLWPCRFFFLLWILAPLACVLLASKGVEAVERPSSRTGEYSAYEKQSLQEALEMVGAQTEPAPEGKIVEDIDVVSLEVFEKRDPAPGFLNIFHTKTRREVVKREVLLGVGDAYSQVLCDETARNLRRFSRLSLVACIAEKGSRPDRVRILVVTKDVWSLRLNWDFRLAGGKLEFLELVPSEENLLGTHQTAAAHFVRYPLSYSLGGRYVIPRLFGSWVNASAEANLVRNIDTGKVEGSFGQASIGQPLYSTRAKWAWSAPVAWANEMTRRYVNARLGTFDARSTSVRDNIPFEYRSKTVALAPSVTRSFGWGLKNDISAGYELSRRDFVANDLSEYDPLAVAEFRRRAIPASDNKSGPYLMYRTYRTDFLRVLDFETLSLQEDLRLGHELYAKLWPSVQAFSSSRNVVLVAAGAQYTQALGDGLARVGVESTTEHVSDGLSDASVQVVARVVTPRLGFGRLVLDSVVLNRYKNFLNRNSFLGGEARLRGYPTRYFYGKDLVAYNLEFRSRPVEILTCQIGGTAFFDVGDAFDGFRNMRIKQAAGVGVRGMFPQLDRMVLRIDVGFPLTPGHIPSSGFPGQVMATFGQAFGLPSISP